MTSLVGQEAGVCPLRGRRIRNQLGGVKYVIRLHWRLVLAVCGVMMADSNSIVERPSFLPSSFS